MTEGKYPIVTVQNISSNNNGVFEKIKSLSKQCASMKWKILFENWTEIWPNFGQDQVMKNML